jgi:signal peptidase
MLEIKQVNTGTLIPLIKEIIEKGGSTRITVTGMSMYPFLRDKIDSVVLSRHNFSDIQIGDIVMVINGSGEYILHRVIRKKTNSLFLAGDSQKEQEGPFFPESIIALVTSVWRNERQIKCSSIWWKILSFMWIAIRPFRNIFIKIFKAYRKIKKIVMNLFN